MKIMNVYSHPGEGVTHFSNKIGIKEKYLIMASQNKYI
jgi:hypothetical protein